MRNILDEKPSSDLHGRLLFSTQFVAESAIRNKQILDIGCGYGWFGLNAIKRGCKSFCGIEICEGDLKTAKKNIEHENINFKVGNATALPFSDNEFDTVVAWEVIEHIQEGKEDIMFKEVSRVLRPGGVFYMSTPHKTFFCCMLDPAWWLIGHRHYSENQLKDYATRNGFRIESMITKGSWWEIIGINNLYVAKWLFRRKPFFEHYIVKKLNDEYLSPGFTNIFCRFRNNN